jgi:hypothetical protein
VTEATPHVHPHPHGAAGPIGGGKLGKQIGPLPLGLWVAAIGGGLFIAYRARKRASSAAPVAVSSMADAGPLDNTQPGAGNLAGVPTSDTDSAGQLVTGPADNDAWWQLGVRQLSTSGYDAYAVQNALTHYLEGYTLTMTEQAIVGEAIVRVGPPPIAPPSPQPGGIVPDPTVPTTPGQTYIGPLPGSNTSPVPTGPNGEPYLQQPGGQAGGPPQLVPTVGAPITTPTNATTFPTDGSGVLTQTGSGAWAPVTPTAANTHDNGNGVPITQTHVIAAGGRTLAQIAADMGVSTAEVLANNPNLSKTGKIPAGTRVTL